MDFWEESRESAPLVIVHPHYRRPIQLLSRLLAYDQALHIRVPMGSRAEDITQEVMRSPFSPKLILVQDLDVMLPDEQLRLMRHFAARQLRAVIFTRDVHRTWFRDPDLQGSMKLFDDLDELGIAKEGQPRLDVFAFGQGEAYLDGHHLTKWEGEMPKSLFFFMVHRRIASRDEILETLWPGVRFDAALNAFHVMKTRLRKLLGSKMFVHDTENELYRISPHVAVHYDVHHFYSLLQPVAGENTAERRQRLRNSLWLARQGFLVGMDQAWVVEPHRILARRRNELLLELSEISAGEDDYEAALGFVQRALALRSRQPELVLHMLRLYEQMGRPCEGLVYAERILRDKPQARQWLRVMQVVAHLRAQCR